MRAARSVLVIASVAVLALVYAPGALAHVTIPDSAPKGGFGIVTFSVPNERPDASTVSLEVKLPEDHPLPFVSAQPKPGWEVETTMRTLDEPVDAFGEEVTEVVDTVTWTGGEVAPGQFDLFNLSVGPLPEDVDSLMFPTIQTYDSDEEVAWIEPTVEGEEEPEHPAPVLQLVGTEEEGEDATTDAGEEAAATTEDDGGDGLAIAALVVGGLALVVGIAALATGRRRTP